MKKYKFPQRRNFGGYEKGNKKIAPIHLKKKKMAAPLGFFIEKSF